MRLHHLRVSAFGPFAGTEDVDFDALGADGLFLLHGPTGAGKTTVLDAVAFALFGELPGARQDPDGRRLRSDHAATGAAPRVELELTVGGQRLRLERSPEHQRPKKRGTGTTTEQARASLTWLDRPGAEGVTRIDEVAREVQRLLGMSADQFFHVVLLPQGEFARFLRTGTAERSTLLERLFDTRRFGAAEDWLAERRRSTGATAEDGARQVGVLLARLSTAAGHTDALPSAAACLPWARALLDTAEGVQESASAALVAARARVVCATGRLHGAQEPVRVLARRDRAHQQLLALDGAQAQRSELAARVEAARRAEPVLAAVADAASGTEVAARAAVAVAGLTREVVADADGADAVERDDLAPCSDRWRAEAGRLGELESVGAELGSLRARVRSLDAAQQQLAAARSSTEQRRTALPARRDRAAATLLAAQRAAATLPALAAGLERAKDAAAAAAQVPPLRRAHAAAETTRTAALVEHQRLREDWLDLRELRLDGMAAELAGSLRTGHGCAVCGSTDHPRPARATLQVVSDADEQRAHEAEQGAGAAAQSAAAAVTTALRELDAALAACAGLDLDAADDALGEAERTCTEAGVLAARVEPAERECAALAAEADALGSELERTARELAEVRTEQAGLETVVADVRARLDSARGLDSDVASRRRRLESLSAAATRLLAARAALAAAERTATERVARAAELAAENGFDAPTAAQAARLAPSELAAATALLDTARDERAAARAVLAEPEVLALGVLDEPTATEAVQRARTELAEAEEALAVAQGAHATAAERTSTLAGLLAELEDRLAALGPCLAEAERVAALADVVAGRGQNARKVSLHSYVLAARLEQVAVAASLRLRRMSAGRYEFVHSDAAGPRGTRGGLGLDVLDDHTGVVRSTKTLSGGESFLASLSLALGLADVVAEEAGGVQLDTLFIDEGFGTLDPAALEEVMAVLDELRAGGRVVGLVSHVDELRQRIPNRLHVTPSRTGSHLRASTS